MTEETPKTEDKPKATKPKPGSRAKLYMEIAAAIDGMHPGFPPFPASFHVVEPEPGVRLLLLADSNRVVSYVKNDALSVMILSYFNNSGKNRFVMTAAQSREATLTWMFNATPIAEPPAVCELSAPGLTFHRLPFDVPEDSFATPPLFEELLSRCSNNMALAAFIGSLFYPQADRQQYVWVHGEGENGKGAIAYVLQRLLGQSFHSENVPDMKYGPNQFWTSSFLSKRFVLFPDCTSPEFPQSGLFKSLTGGDVVRIEKKGRDAFSAELHCKFMFFSNEELIISSQKSDQRRAIFCHIEPIKEKTDGYYEKLWAEAPLIMRECLSVYRQACPTHGTIALEDDSLHLADMQDAEYINIFERCFNKIKDEHLLAKDRAFVSGSDMQSLLVLCGLKNPRDQNKCVSFFMRHYNIRKVQVDGSRVYVGLAKRELAVVSPYGFSTSKRRSDQLGSRK